MSDPDLEPEVDVEKFDYEGSKCLSPGHIHRVQLTQSDAQRHICRPLTSESKTDFKFKTAFDVLLFRYSSKTSRSRIFSSCPRRAELSGKLDFVNKDVMA